MENINPATQLDVAKMVALSYEKRRQYEVAQPLFWRYGGPQAEVVQAEYFTSMLDDERYIVLVLYDGNILAGFVIGKLMLPPEVYTPGLTLFIDDFCIKNGYSWPKIGQALLTEITKIAQEKGAKQTVIVCGNHDMEKADFLRNNGMNIASNWYTKPI